MNPILKPKPGVRATRADGRLAFTAPRQRIRQPVTNAEWQAQRRRARPPLTGADVFEKLFGKLLERVGR